MRSREISRRTAAGVLFFGTCAALSPSFSGENPCPISCGQVDPGNWTVYHSVDRLDYCNSSILLSFSAFNPLDNSNNAKTLRACAVENTERDNAKVSVRDIHAHQAISPNSAKVQPYSTNETVSLSQEQSVLAQTLWNEVLTVGEVDISTSLEQLQSRLDVMDASHTVAQPRLLFLYDPPSSTSIGFYAGAGVMTFPIISALSDFVASQGYFGDTLVQACSSFQMNGTLSTNATSSVKKNSIVFAAAGIVSASGPGSLVKAQRAVGQWANSSCVTEGYTQTSTLPARIKLVPLAKSGGNQLSKRGTCSTTSVGGGDLCADLARRCGISTTDLLKYNNNNRDDFCTTLRVPQLVCCSEGNLPVPVSDSNGNCKTHEVQPEENCWSMANDNSFLFSADDLEGFNKNTWGWGGCGNLQAGTIICLSPGNPPLPKPIPGAMCGPVKPGTVAPPPGTVLASLNPCPLNSCCDVWGFCGTTEEFCRPVPAGQTPGAPQPIGAPNCISNCGAEIVNNESPPASFISIGYFEGYGISRSCQDVDIRNIDMSKYTHIHFAFATVTADNYEVNMEATINQYYYFKRTSGAKKILSFGGWSFSTDEGLDGVDIDWEYPAAPDMPNIPTADPEEGENYFLFLQKLRSILPPSKSVSFAAPASFWYLRGFPIAKIVDVVDYVVFMTYDLHGQWDYGNKWTDSGCPGGNCLRSHLNFTETVNALSMITKAGVPANKIAVGIASYGRSFQMTDPRCTGPMCTYTGRESGATPGRCTKTAGYISNAEIPRKFSDGDGADVLVYNDDQWVSYMEDDTKASRVSMYKSMNFMGTTDWAISLDDAGLVDQDSDDYFDDVGDDSGDLGPMKQSWREAGEIADATMKYSPHNKFQRVLDLYFGPISVGEHQLFFDNFERLWESHWGLKKKKSGKSLGMNLHARFFCGNGIYDEIWGKKTLFNVCLPRHNARQGGITYQTLDDWQKKSNVYTIFCEHATHHRDTMSLSQASDEADGWNYHLNVINMWQNKVRPLTFYHENMHWRRVSRPWCAASLGTNKNGAEVPEKYGLRGIMNLPYEMKKKNAENWSLAAMAMWIMDGWGGDVPIPVYKAKRDEMEETLDLEEDDDYDQEEDYYDQEEDDYDPEWEAEMKRAEEAFQQNYDPARINPAKFKPLFDEDEVVHEINSCNATTDEPLYKREEFRDTFGDENMSEWKVYKGQFHVSSGGLQAGEAVEGEAVIYRHKVADFVFEADITFPASETGGDAGLIFRATHPNDTKSGHTTGSFYAGISPSSGQVFLNVMPSNVSLASAETNAEVGKATRIKVQAVNETISVYVGDMRTPKLVQRDATFDSGFNGVQVHNTSATFSNVEITPVVRQQGILHNCKGFYRAVAGDTCQAIADKHDTISLAQLHSWNPALLDDCSGLKTDYFYCVARDDAFRLKTRYSTSCDGDVHNDVTLTGNEGKCIDTGCSVGSLDIASGGDCPNGQVQVSYWELPGCSGKWFGFGYASRDTCRSLWTSGWKFGSLHLRCADPLSDCVSQGTCVADEEPARGICEAVPADPPAAFKFQALARADCTGDVHKELSVDHGNGLCLDTECQVGSLDIAELGDCPDGQVRISYWGGEKCGGAWYGYGYGSRNTCRTLWSAGSKFKSLWLSCAKESDDCVSQKTCTSDPEPAGNLC
ncbi:class V chitinase Chi100 [Cordyceps militaris CM01]|uniref:chitinase n=1 Tax=Cordyceps militaris (strain CM01) TaxID=983644 RepID=G3JHV4_CORMM|nr:class V chitinase Chi100 [Cordyceps militaris CM01]EGX90960.1 class V chitinase Chi100 [Cordyceps militaris CM01]